MSLVLARQRRSHLFASIAGLLLIVGLVSLISVEDPGGATLRIGIIMVALGSGLWMQRSWELIPITLLAWLAPNFGRSVLDETYTLFQAPMLLEAVGALAVAGLASVTRGALKDLETESRLIGSNGEGIGLGSETHVFAAHQMRPSLESELARARRFGRTFALVLVGIDEMRQKYDYRDPAIWEASLAATARLLRNTRHNVDRVFHYGENGFAMILPESSEKDVVGMVRRLRRLARVASPAEGEPGGPLHAHYGATFFPSRATTIEDLLRRAEIAMKIAEKSTLRYQLDSAEAPEMPPAETLRRPAIDAEVELLDTANTTDDLEGVATGPRLGDAADERLSADTIDGPITVVTEELGLPAGEPVVAASDAILRANDAPTSDPFDDIETLLKQMDETLSMIRSVRAGVA